MSPQPLPGDPQETPAPYKVLLVDDHEWNRLLAVKWLKKWGLEVTCAVNGAEAVRLAAETPFELIFMDLQMPKMDGYEATRRIRALGGNIPIIALTASVEEDVLDKIRAAGMTDYMTKPFNPRELHAKIIGNLRESSLFPPYS